MDDTLIMMSKPIYTPITTLFLTFILFQGEVTWQARLLNSTVVEFLDGQKVVMFQRTALSTILSFTLSLTFHSTIGSIV